MRPIAPLECLPSQSHQQPLLGAVFANVQEARSFVFGQVIQACFDDACFVVPDGEGDLLTDQLCGLTMRIIVHSHLLGNLFLTTPFSEQQKLSGEDSRTK